MSFRKRKLFRFKKIHKWYELDFFRGADDPTVTEVVIPGRHWFRRVIGIKWECFKNCKYLRRVYIPDSVFSIDAEAFLNCPELLEIRLPREFRLESPTFVKCPKLDPETVLLGCVGGKEKYIHWPLNPFGRFEWDELLRPDVFELTIKYDSFRRIGTDKLYKELVRRGLISHFKMLEQAGRSPSAEETDELIRFSVENKMTEMTAYFLEYKKRKFGFSGGGDFEL